MRVTRSMKLLNLPPPKEMDSNHDNANVKRTSKKVVSRGTKLISNNVQSSPGHSQPRENGVVLFKEQQEGVVKAVVSPVIEAVVSPVIEAVVSPVIEQANNNNLETSITGNNDEDGNHTSKKVVSRKTFWDNSTHMTFVEVCLEEVRNGNRPRTHFNKKGWVNVITKLKARTGKDFCKPQLKNHWDTMKKDWKIYDSLMRIESGLQLDPVRKTIDATPEWWDEKIKAHPEFAKFRDKNLEMHHMYYEKLFAANKEGNGNRDESSLGDSVETESSIIKKKKKENNSNAPSKRRKTTGVSSSVELQAHNHVPRKPMSLLLQALSSPSSQTFPPQTRVPSIADPSIADCMDIVATFPGFEPSSALYNKALRIFWKKEARESFMYPPSSSDKINFLKSLLNE